VHAAGNHWIEELQQEYCEHGEALRQVNEQYLKAKCKQNERSFMH